MPYLSECQNNSHKMLDKFISKSYELNGVIEMGIGERSIKNKATSILNTLQKHMVA